MQTERKRKTGIARCAALAIGLLCLTLLFAGCSGQTAKDTMHVNAVLEAAFRGPNALIVRELDVLSSGSPDAAVEAELNEAWSGLAELCNDEGFEDLKDVLLLVHVPAAEAGCSFSRETTSITPVSGTRDYLFTVRVKTDNGITPVDGKATFDGDGLLAALTLEDPEPLIEAFGAAK